MFIAALFTTVKTWKPPKGPSTDAWIKTVKCVCMHIMELLLNHKKEWNNAIGSNKDRIRDHTKQSKSERERQIPYDIIYM